MLEFLIKQFTDGDSLTFTIWVFIFIIMAMGWGACALPGAIVKYHNAYTERDKRDAARVLLAVIFLAPPAIVLWPLVVTLYWLFFVGRAFWRLVTAADPTNRLNK